MICSSCQNAVPDGSRFCTHCGHRLDDPASETPAEDVPATLPAGGVPEDPGGASTMLTDGTVLGDVVVRRTLGEGTFGVVWLVERTRDGRPFVLKVYKLVAAGHRAGALRELRTWIDLPPHPHIVQCHQLRTIGDGVGILAEFVEGASLHHAIADGRCRSLASLLDVAIQFAWGLHAAHEAGVLHRDVKPLNAMLGTDGTLKVMDFGISATRRFLDVPEEDDFLSTSVGGTRAYASPEQLEDDAILTRASDQWGWAASVLHMIHGDVVWHAIADPVEMLDAYRTEGPAVPETPRVPEELLDVMARCFALEPTDRWPSLLDVAGELTHIHESLVGPYPRAVPDFPQLERRLADESLPGDVEPDVAAWLGRAAELTGADSGRVTALMKSGHFTETGRLADKIAALDGLRLRFEDAVASGRAELRVELGRLLLDIAFLHRLVADHEGALQFGERAIEVRDELATEIGDSATRTAYLAALGEQGRTLSFVGRHDEAAKVFDRGLSRALSEWTRTGDEAADWEMDAATAQLLYDKGCCAFDRGAVESARYLFDRAIVELQGLARRHWTADIARRTVDALRNQATVLTKLGEHDEALHVTEIADDVEGQILREAPEADDERVLILSLTERAGVLAEAGRPDEAITVQREAITRLQRLVDAGHSVYVPDLARAQQNLGVVLARSGDLHLAIASHDSAVALLRRVVDEEGRSDLEFDLAKAMTNRVVPLRDLRRFEDAEAQLEEAIARLERLLQHETAAQLRWMLAMAYTDRAYIAYERGRTSMARRDFEEAAALFRELADARPPYPRAAETLRRVEQNLRSL